MLALCKSQPGAQPEDSVSACARRSGSFRPASSASPLRPERSRTERSESLTKESPKAKAQSHSPRQKVPSPGGPAQSQLLRSAALESVIRSHPSAEASALILIRMLSQLMNLMPPKPQDSNSPKVDFSIPTGNRARQPRSVHHPTSTTSGARWSRHPRIMLLWGLGLGRFPEGGAFPMWPLRRCRRMQEVGVC